MADIFLSYANEDRQAAARLAALLESAGWRVWWDRRIPAGRSWRSVLEEALRDAGCMIVLWSEDSVKSPWVAEEAEEARRLGKTFVPVLIHKVEPPMGFRAIQAADLINWDGTDNDPAARMFIADLGSLLPRPESQPFKRSEVLDGGKTGTRSSMVQRMSDHWLPAAIGGLAILSLLAGWQIWLRSKPETPPPTDTAVRQDSDIQAAARLVQLSVSAARQEIRPAEALPLAVTASYSDGTRHEVKDGIAWTSSNAKVAAVNERGEVTALQSGTAAITAKIGDVVSSAWTLRVVDAQPAIASPKLVSLQVIASKKELTANEKISLGTKGRFSDSSEKSLSIGIDWEISDRTIATISASGELRALRPGTVQVAARSGNLLSAPMTFLVKDFQRPVLSQTKQVKALEARVVKPTPTADPSKAQITELIDRAKSYREQGNYVAAMAELEKAKGLDAFNDEVRKEMEQTRKACNAERVLGHKPIC